MKQALRNFLINRLAEAPASAPPEDVPEQMGVALLVTEDKASLQWGPGWLHSVGLDVRTTQSSIEALGLTLATRADLVIVDQNLRDERNRCVLEVLRNIHGDELPILALCANPAEASAALAAGATDVVRRPFDWQLVANRAVRALEAREAQAKLRFASSALERLQQKARPGISARRAPDATDSLTGLPNGERFRDLLQETLSSLAASNDEVGVAVLGLESFEAVNDAVGVQNANRVLQEFAERFRACLNDSHVIGAARGGISAPAASLGGARFAILLTERGREEMDRFRDALQTRLNRPFRIDGQSVYLTPRLGVAMGRAAETSPDILLHDAETALVDPQGPESEDDNGKPDLQHVCDVAGPPD